MATAYTSAQISGTGPNQAGMMAETHKWTDKVGGAEMLLRKVKIDFDHLATQTGVALAANDTFQVMHVNAGETVVFCGFHIDKVATGAADIDFGLTGGDVDGFIDGIEANDASPTVVAAPFGLLSGTYFSSGDTLDAKALSASLAGCICTFWALIFRNV